MEEKLEIAQQLARLGVDIIEAGFPIASPGDFEAVREIAKIVKTSTIAGLCRAHQVDIDRCAEALKPEPPQRWHFTFLSPSLIRPLPSQLGHFSFFFGGFCMAFSRSGW